MLKYALFWFVLRVLGRLPLSVLYLIADAVAAVSFRMAGASRRNVVENLRHVMPDATRKQLRETAKQIFRNVCYYYADLADIPRMDVIQFFRERLILHGVYERLVPAVAQGRPVILLSAHYGNPELVVQGFSGIGVEGFAVTEPVAPKRLSRMLDDIRSSHGHEFRAVGVASVKRMMQRLKTPGVVIALMGDRDIEGPKMLLPFFGEETWMPTGPIEVGLRTGAIIFPSFCVRRNKRIIEAYLEEPIELERTDDLQRDVKRAAMVYIGRLEARLRAEPGQWAVLERIWDDGRAVAKPSPERAVSRG